MPRYEYTQGSSNKYWEITLQSHAVITHYGRIGTDGQSTTKTFKSEAEAKSAYDKLIAEKTKSGYVLKAGAIIAAEAPKEIASSNPLIARLDKWMVENRKYFHLHLNPGAAAEDLAKFEEQLGRKLPQTFKDFMAWKNGEDDQGPSERFIDNYSTMSLEHIAKTARGMKGIEKPDEFKGEHYWHESWVPFLENGGGDYLCIDLDGVLGKRGAVIEYWHDEDKRSICYDSIDDMLKKFVTALEDTNWNLEDNGYFSWSESEEEMEEKFHEHEDDDEAFLGEEDANPPASLQAFMKKEFPGIAAGIDKALGRSGVVALHFDKCGDAAGALLARGLKQVQETINDFSQLNPSVLKPIQHIAVRPDEQTHSRLVGDALNVWITNDKEYAEKLEIDVDNTIGHALEFPALRQHREWLQNYMNEINNHLRSNIALEMDWRSFVSHSDKLENLRAISRLMEEMGRCVLYNLRSVGANDKAFRQRLRQAVRKLRVEHVESARDKKLFAEGSEIVCRLCLSGSNDGTFGSEFEDLLRKAVMKMKAEPAAPISAEEKDDFVPSKPPSSAKGLLSEIDDVTKQVCQAVRSVVGFEVDWQAFASNDIDLDEVWGLGVLPFSNALRNLCENDQTRAKVADRLRRVRIRRAATPAEKKITVNGATLTYRLAPNTEHGQYDVDMLQEYIEELLEAMRPGAPTSDPVVKEIEQLESKLSEVSAGFAKIFDRDVPVEIDKESIGNNLLAVQEMDLSALSNAIKLLAKDKEAKSRLVKFAEQLSKITIRAVDDSDRDTRELVKGELILVLPEIPDNISGFIRDQLREIEYQEREEEQEQQKRDQKSSLGPQFVENFKSMQEYTKQALSIQLEGDVKAMVVCVTGPKAEKAIACFENWVSNFLNALVMGRAEDEAFARQLEKVVKGVRLECAKEREKKDLSFDNGILICTIKMTDGKSGAHTQKEYQSKIKKLIGA